MNSLFWAIVVLGALIFVHELGHFLVARWFGVRVLIFSLGFGPRLFGWKSPKDGTDYQVAVVPLGGYVRMLGEGDEEPVAEEEKPFSFSHKGVGPRFAIVAAGPLFNFLFAIVVLWMTCLIGFQELLPVVGSVKEGMPAARSGLKSGDRILSVEGEEVSRWETMSARIRASSGEPLRLSIERDSKLLELVITPVIEETPNLFGEPERRAMIGITPKGDSAVITYGVVEGFFEGMRRTWSVIDLTLTTYWKLLTRVVSPDQIGGPIMIAELILADNGNGADYAGPDGTAKVYQIAYTDLGAGSITTVTLTAGSNIIDTGFGRLIVDSSTGSYSFIPKSQ
ncbi:MAG: site-2 protease family protein, partial [Magnetococcales bacterium]|nr:site-2 protease family protein [Magnetococcales bacterium]